jgi:AbrB family looped-hinge helix DNA binding protein
MTYTTVTEKGQITIPSEMRRALKLTPGKKLAVTLEGSRIFISKQADVEDVRKLLKKEMAAKGTEKIKVKSGDGWAEQAKEKYGGKS